MQTLKERSDKAQYWLKQQAFPFWAQRGTHPAWGFHEKLDLSGAPASTQYTRTRVQARQTFCFALACSLGWKQAHSTMLVRRGVDALLNHCRRSDGLYGQNISRVNARPDGPIDLYDSAFVLLALTWATKTLEDKDLRSEANALGTAIDKHLTHPSGGYYEQIPHAGRRLQNPHMHLFEASLAHAEHTKDKASLRRCANIAKLAQTRFCDRNGTLRECFADDWTHLPDSHVESGHQFEWVWLLSQWRTLSDAPIAAMQNRLYASGLRLTADDGRLPLSHHIDGDTRENYCRCWSQTEALKAHLAMAAGGDARTIRYAGRSYDLLFKDHIAPATQGGWIDATDRSGRPLSTDMPASTGYHLFLALAELMRFTRDM